MCIELTLLDYRARRLMDPILKKALFARRHLLFYFILGFRGSWGGGRGDNVVPLCVGHI